MYFRLISGVKPEGELTQEEQHRVDIITIDIIEEYLNNKHRFNNDDQIIKSHVQDEGFIYLAKTKIGTKQHNFEYFVSSFEFGPPRKDINDRRFDFQWKDTMVKHLKKFAPEFVEQYLTEWANLYRQHRMLIRKNIPIAMHKDFDISTEKACSISCYIDEETLETN